MAVPFILRQMTSDDESYIYNSFLLCLHDSYPMKFVTKTLYFKPQTKIIKFLLETASCSVACFPEDPSEIIGWVLHQDISDALVIHYIYVSKLHRNKYVGSDMLDQIKGKHQLVIATHVSDEYARLKHKIENCKVLYDPFLIDKLRDLHVSG